MKWKSLNKLDAEAAYNRYCLEEKVECPDEYQKLRGELIQAFNDALDSLGISIDMLPQNNNRYQIDCLFGLSMYMLLNDEYGMNVRAASDEGIWRYISLIVVPDILSYRYPEKNPDRFWKKPKRLWLRTLWWYIYLSWQGDKPSTYRVIKDNSTDEILQLVDRCGKTGYRTELYRNLMAKYARYPAEEKKKQIFRRMMVLNTAKVQVVEPELVVGGASAYIDSLYDYLIDTNASEG